MKHDDLGSGILPKLGPPVRRRGSGSFRAWHRPRKQAVRWDHLGNLVLRSHRAKPTDQQAEIKYLGLPGSDFLDVRSILKLPDSRFVYRARGSSPTDADSHSGPPQIMFVAFDTGADCQSDGNVDSSVSQVDIRANNRVSSRSRIIRDDFRTLGTPNSVNHLQVSDYAPYDIVNLDFCDSILQPGLKGESMYRALLELFVLQRPAARGWGLILTSRVDSESVSASALEDLTLLVNNGLESANDRAAAFQGMFRSSTPFAFSEDEVTFRGSMSFALPFWISQIAAQEGLSVSVLPVIHYSVLESTSELEWGDLASFAFFFERSDDRSIAFPGDLEVVALDGRLNDRFDAVFSALSNAVQIDHRLAVRSSPEYLQACIEHSKALLRDAGWDVSGYDDWAYEQAMLFGLSSDI